MITEHDLAEAIAECEGQRNPTSSTCLKLAAFYTIKDKLYPAKKEVIELPMEQYYSRSAGPIESESKFRQAIVDINEEDFLDIMDELMTTLQALMPKLYDGVMRKLTKE